MLFECCQGGNQPGEGAADGELCDVVFPEGLGDGVDVLIPNDLGEVDEVVSSILAAAVSPEGSRIDALRECCKSTIISVIQRIPH